MASFSLPRYSRQEWRIAGAVFASYLIVYELAAIFVPAVAPLYPASAIALAGLFFGGLRLWPVVYLAALLTAWRTGIPLPYLIVLPVAKTLAACVGAFSLRRARLDPLFRRYRDMFYFLAAIIITSLILPLLRVATDALLGVPVSLASFGAHYTAMLVSLLTVTPFILRWFTKPRFSRSPSEWAEVAVVFALLIGLDIAVFAYRIPAVLNVPLVYLLLIPFFWTSLRLRPRFVSLAILITSVFGVMSVLYHPTTLGLVQDMYQMEAFLITFASIFLILVSLEEDRRVNTNLLRSQLATLENAVARISSESNAKNDFIAILAHELRNPLAPIVSSIELLKFKGQRDDEERKLLDLMEERMDTVKRLLDDLLDISRITEGKIALKREVLDLKAVIQRAVLSTEHYIKERHQTLTLKFPKNAKFVLGDPVRLEQVFSNLIVNASKYSHPGDTLTLTMQRADDEIVEVRIRDNGIGIDPVHIEAIFTPFHQADEAGRSKKGLGIGLALVRSFVEMHGGTVKARSQGKGKGSEFIVRLPLHAVVAPPAHEQHPEVGNAGSAVGFSVLVVDDNDAAAAGIGRLLELRGCHITYAYDGRQAIDEAMRTRPDAVLLDVGLPDQDGYAVAKILRTRGYQGRLIALTGFSTDDAREKGKEAGFDHYLIKPAGFADLKQVIPEIA